VLAGDIEPAAAFALVEKYFGAIPRHEPPAPVDAEEPVQDGERRSIVRRQAELPAVLIGYKAIAINDPDRAAFDVATRVLSGGESSRLERDMVREKEVATSVDADLEWGIDQELFIVEAKARPGKTAADLEGRIDAVLADLAVTPVPDAELAKAKRQLEAEFVRGMKTVGGKANQIGFFDVVAGDYKKLFSLEEAVRKMTSLAAANVGISNRGRIAPGVFADLVLFDPAVVADRADFGKAQAQAVGVRSVWVNGRVVFQDGKTTAAFPGRTLKR